MRALALALILIAPMATAESWQSIRDRRPELFHPDTGFRIARQRAPTPYDIPAPVRLASPFRAKALLRRGALPVDVFGALQSRYDELDGTWLVEGPRDSLPGAVWLPEVGRGALTPEMADYLETSLDRLTEGERTRPLVVFCVADCWMSWNAAQRMSALGYFHVWWYRLGTDGWRDMGWPLEPVTPVPVTTD